MRLNEFLWVYAFGAMAGCFAVSMANIMTGDKFSVIPDAYINAVIFWVSLSVLVLFAGFKVKGKVGFDG